MNEKGKSVAIYIQTITLNNSYFGKEQNEQNTLDSQTNYNFIFISVLVVVYVETKNAVCE